MTLRRIIILFWFFMILIPVGCRKENLPDCGCDGKSYGKFSIEPAIIKYTPPDDYLLIIIESYPGPFLPCNLPDTGSVFFTNNLKVIVSGEIKGICPNWSIVGVPAVFTKLEVAPK